MRDLLFDQPARPSSLVRGHWIVQLDVDHPEIVVRRFIRSTASQKLVEPVPSPPDGQEDGLPNGRDVPGGSGATDTLDPLERAWRVINAASTSGNDRVSTLLHLGCAVAVRHDQKPQGEPQGKQEVPDQAEEPEEVGDESTKQAPSASEEDQDVLWCFSSGETPELEDKLSTLVGLKELPPLDALEPAQLVSCPTHGHDLGCLSSTPPIDLSEDAGSSQTRRCTSVRWSPSAETGRHWDILTQAIVEGMAWRRGTRISMRDGQYSIGSGRPFTASLVPMDDTRLVLKIYPRPPLQCTSLPQSPLPRHLRPLMLEPLRLPALSLGSFDASATQHTTLLDGFTAALGTQCMANSKAADFMARLERRTHHPWTVYWIPLVPKERSTGITELSPLELTEQWRERQGILTIWPTHLEVDLAPLDVSNTSHLPDVQKVSFPATAQDLLDTAGSLFSSISSMSAPRPDDPTNDSAPIAMETLGVAGISPESPILDVQSIPEDNDSDLDDLFSTHSDEKISPEVQEEDETGFELLSEIDDEEVEAVETEQDEDMASPEDVVTGLEEGDTNQVTEDDFNFFDSPAHEVQPGQSPQADLKTPRLEAIQNEETNTPQSGSMPGSSPRDAMNHSPLQQVVSASHPQGTGLEQDTSMTDTAAVSDESPGPADGSIEDPDQSDNVIMDEAVPALIPSSFEAVPLDTRRPPTFTYSLPSPGPTPESIPTDYADQLKHPPAAKKVDYSSLWETGTDMSESQMSEDPTGAPPTPMSMDEDLNVDEDTRLRIGEGKGGAIDGELRWHTHKCISVEWAWDGVESATAVAWDSSWEESSEGKELSEVHLINTPNTKQGWRRIRDTIDFDKLANMVITSRSFRDLLRLDHKLDRMDVNAAASWNGAEATLSEFLPSKTEIDEHGGVPTVLSSCDMHVSMSGNLMRLSTAGLQYWRQLGLQPLSGNKTISIVALCLEKERAWSQQVLLRLVQVYEELQLGHMRFDLVAELQGGVLVESASQMTGRIGSLSFGDTHNRVILVILPHSNGVDPSNIGIITSADLPFPPSDTCIVHAVPASSLHLRDLPALAFEIYDKIPMQVEPIRLRGTRMEQPSSFVKAPHFTLPSDKERGPELSLAWPLHSYDVMHRWKMVHLAYTYDPELGITVAFAMDGEGQHWETTTWVEPNESRFMVRELWKFLDEFRRTCAVESRIAVCRHGEMPADELQEWERLSSSKRVPFTLLTTDGGAHTGSNSRPHLRTSTAVPSTLYADPYTRIMDESLSANFTSLPHTLPISLPLSCRKPNTDDSTRSTETVCPQSSFLFTMTTGEGSWQTSAWHVLIHRPVPGKEDEDLDALFAEEYYRLAVLGRRRFGFVQGSTLPAHQEGVGIVVDSIRALANSKA